MLQNKNIFIVDDSPFWSATLSKILKGLGFNTIMTYSNGTDCLKNLSQNPDILFLDFQMDDMDGLEVLKEVKNYNANIEVIFCTAHEDLGVAVDAINTGSFDYLLKSNANKKEVAIIMEKLNEKTKRLEEYKEQKHLFSLKKKELQENIAKQKQEVMKKFEKINKSSGITVNNYNLFFSFI